MKRTSVNGFFWLMLFRAELDHQPCTVKMKFLLLPVPMMKSFLFQRQSTEE